MWENTRTEDFMEVLKIFGQECSNDDLGLILGFLWQCQICLLLYGKSS